MCPVVTSCLGLFVSEFLQVIKNTKLVDSVTHQTRTMRKGVVAC